jgi:hypothetical protein
MVLESYSRPALFPSSAAHEVESEGNTRTRQGCEPPARPRLWMYSIQEVDRLLTAAGLKKVEGRTLEFGPFSLLNVKLLPDGASLNLHRRLQSLTDRRLPFLRSAGIEYMVLARKPG